MPDSPNLLSGKGKYLAGAILLLFGCAIFAAFTMPGSDDFNIGRREVLLRNIGHELLLQSGDSTSRVLPVKKIAENEYQISFERELTFQSDSLVNTTQRLLAKDPLTGDYVVNVLNCGNASVAYGYAISKNEKGDIVPCRGRKQPRACYMINIKFKPTGINKAVNGYVLGSLPFLAFVGFIFLRAKPRKALPNDKFTKTFTLG
ncbi:MAG: transcriptional regulator, partial [Mucilaginibacter sp.]